MENNGNGGAGNQAGVYVHKESGAELTALNEQQADGFVRMGYEYKGPAKSREDKEALKEAEQADKPEEHPQPEGSGPVGATENVQAEDADKKQPDVNDDSGATKASQARMSNEKKGK